MRRIFDYMVGTFVFLSAVFYLPGNSFNDAQTQLFKISALLIFALALYFKPIRSIPDYGINAFLILAALSFFINIKARAAAIEPLVTIVLVTLLYYSITSTLEKKDVIYAAIVGVIIVNALILITQALKIDPICLSDNREPNIRLVGLFGFPMSLGAWTAVVLPYVYHKNKYFFILALFMLFASGSYAAIGLGIGGLLVYMFYQQKMMFKACASICAVMIAGFVIYAGLMANGVEQRDILNKISLRVETQWPLARVILSKPYFGYGLGTWKYVVPQVKEIDFERIGEIDIPWSDYTGVALEMGIPAVIVLLYIMRGVYRKFRRSKKSPEACAIFAGLSTIPFAVAFHSYMNYVNIAVVCLAMYCLFNIKMEEEQC